ncbi:MAG: nucleotidyltransferase family protein [Verrucomicrobiales bacterium]|nr:nucleotidyltransferase family protein [Verrucomicrobiales bacterium]
MEIANYNSGKSVWPNRCWPNEGQTLLLKACAFEDSEETRAAFREWEEAVPFPLVDTGSKRLFLTLFERLKEWGIAYESADQWKRVVQSAWFQQEGVERELGGILDQLDHAEIPAILLKGAALNEVVYPDKDRLMTDIDVAVPRDRCEEAIAALEADGWIPQFRNPERLSEITHGCHFRRGRFGHLDLHWDFFHGRYLTASEQEEFWQDSIERKRMGRPARTLSPADQLLHTCEHGVRYNEVAPVRWLLDAVRVIRTHDAELDWERLIRMAGRHGLSLPVQQTLRYLAEELAVEIPEEARAEVTVSRRDRSNHAVIVRRFTRGHYFWDSLPAARIDYQNLLSSNPGLRLSDYLARVNDLEPPLSRRLPELIRFRILRLFYPAVRWMRGIFESVREQQRVRLYHVSHLEVEFLEGFHHSELLEKGSFRWSQPTAVFRLPLPEGGAKIEWEILEFRPLTEELGGELEIFVNGYPVSSKQLDQTEQSLSVEIDSSQYCQYPVQRIELRLPKWEVDSNDSRELGLAFQWVRISAFPES